MDAEFRQEYFQLPNDTVTCSGNGEYRLGVKLAAKRIASLPPADGNSPMARTRFQEGSLSFPSLFCLCIQLDVDSHNWEDGRTMMSLLLTGGDSDN
jgi:hypothetical protein